MQADLVDEASGLLAKIMGLLKDPPVSVASSATSESTSTKKSVKIAPIKITLFVGVI